MSCFKQDEVEWVRAVDLNSENLDLERGGGRGQSGQITEDTDMMLFSGEVRTFRVYVFMIKIWGGGVGCSELWL